ncbi:MAG: hypothetical protein V8T10_10185 [Merdibacter sp.]
MMQASVDSANQILMSYAALAQVARCAAQPAGQRHLCIFHDDGL